MKPMTGKVKSEQSDKRIEMSPIYRHYETFLPAVVMTSKLGPVFPDDLLNRLLPGGHDGKPHQHRPQAIFLTNVIWTYRRQKSKNNPIRSENYSVLHKIWEGGGAYSQSAAYHQGAT